jgi:UDP-N-acetylmuramyl tripeptide synthase
VVDVAFGEFPDGEQMGSSAAGAQNAIDEWQVQARRILKAIGWSAEELIWRIHPTGMSLALSAPIDALYAGIEVGEWAWRSTAEVLAGREELPLQDSDELKSMQDAIAKEQDPKLLTLHAAAQEHKVNFCGDDEWTTIGMGCNGQTWGTTEPPEASEVNWDAISDIPCAMVTGTNGKSTTVRAMVEIVRAEGLVPGASSTDWIQVGDETLDKDDWSGPGGARAVLKDKRVEVAILETARGGMLRRGLGVPRVDVAIITNVAADHLGEMGVHDLAALTEVKFTVRRAAQHLVLNADDPEVRRRGLLEQRPVTWYSLNAQDPLIVEHLSGGGEACVLENDELIHCQGSERTPITSIQCVPMTLEGAVRYNIGNALAAVGASLKMGLSVQAIQDGLRNFRSDPQSNPGRLNVFDLGGVLAMVDFAHNPHGMEALFDAASRLPHKRMLVLLGQAGDRDDVSIKELSRITAEAKPDLIVIKELGKYLRGREKGVVSGMIQDMLAQFGHPEDQIEYVEHELDAVRHALDWAQPDDLLLLISHTQREAVLQMLGELQEEGWTPGTSPLLPIIHRTNKAR